VGRLLVGAGPFTGPVVSQAAADPDHQSAHGATNVPRRLAGGHESMEASLFTLRVPALPIDVSVVGMDKHL
jgi:hypothetical protein